MITFSKVNPTIYNLSDLEDLGQKLRSVGSRALLITPITKDLRNSVDLVKNNLVKNSITFIDSDITDSNLNLANLDETIKRAKNFDIQLIISIGSMAQRSAGRYISQELHLPYFEYLTNIDNPLLLNPELAMPNRVRDGVELIHIAPSRIDAMLTIESSLDEKSRIHNQLALISILFDLCQVVSSNCDNYIIDEGKELIKRVINYIKREEYNTKELFHFGLTTARLSSLVKSSDFSLTLYTWVLSIRYKLSSYLVKTKLLPWILDDQFPELSALIREELADYGVNGRLSDLGITLDQAFNINIEDHNAKIIDNAF